MFYSATFCFYKIQYGLVAVSMPSYFESPTRITRHMHSLSFRQVHVFFLTIIGFRFFPMTVVLWNRLPEDLVVLGDLDFFQERSEQDQLSRAIENSICFYPVFISFLLTLTLSSFSHCHAFISHYEFFTFILTHPVHNTQS